MHAVDRMSWSISIRNRLFYLNKMHNGWKGIFLSRIQCFTQILHRNCVVFLLLCELTRSAIIWEMANRVSRRGKMKTVQFRGMFG